jgi:hypothetical protein
MTVPNDPGRHRQPDAHPLWCTRQGCAARGWHASRPLTAVQPGSDQPEPVTARLVQLLAPHADTHLTLTAGRGEGAAGPQLLMTVHQARILRRFLGRLVELAGRAEQ